MTLEQIRDRYIELQHARDELASVQKEWKVRCAELREHFDATLTASGEFPNPKAQLDHAQRVWQDLQEAEVGRKVHVGDAKDKVRALQKDFGSIILNPNQEVLDFAVS